MKIYEIGERRLAFLDIEEIREELEKEKYEFCCDDLENKVRLDGLFWVKNQEVLFNFGIVPMSAGNILTGEKYNPEDFIMHTPLLFCPFCGKRILWENWDTDPDFWDDDDDSDIPGLF